jgi:hypothetical protein
MATHVRMQELLQHTFFEDPVTGFEFVDTQAEFVFMSPVFGAHNTQLTIRTNGSDTPTSISLKWTTKILEYAESQSFAAPLVSNIILLESTKGVSV